MTVTVGLSRHVGVLGDEVVVSEREEDWGRQSVAFRE